MNASILVIDDEESIRFTFERFLTSVGHRVTTAANCREARRKIAEEAYDLVFADIILPDGMGIDLLHDMKIKSPECLVVMITAYPSAETERETLRMGASHYMRKPIRQQDILECLTLAFQNE